mmetsp:Transcript_1384/g.4809  ORF Transcript_1384/g.4809 Transcript_1384/m.4809 type:complete len:392 (-) Transcript_1384:2279-3454(-)
MTILRFRGSAHLRYRLAYSVLSGRSARIDDIRTRNTSGDAENIGLSRAEVSLLRLLEKLTNGTKVEINETGTVLRFKPGIVTGGKLQHDCGTDRAMGYFVEVAVLLALFAKKPLALTLTGITNDQLDPSVDTIRTATLPLLRRFGVEAAALELRVRRRGVRPLGGGEALLRVPIVRSLTPVDCTEEGLVKRVRGVAFGTKVSPQMCNRMVDAARALLNKLLPDVYIFTDHSSGLDAAKSPGFGIALVAETTTGVLLCAECCSEPEARSSGGDMDVPSSHTGGKARGSDRGARIALPEDVGELAAAQLLEEVRRGGVVDSLHQSFLLSLCALTPEDVSRVRLGKITQHTVQSLRHIKDQLGVVFDLQPHSASGTVVLSCVGSGISNLARRAT